MKLVRMDIDIDEDERLSNITFRHTLMERTSACIAVLQE